jgi:hypothetical protein
MRKWILYKPVNIILAYQHFFIIRVKEIESNLMQSSAKIDDLYISQ